jgi:hypothetical protein
MMFKDFINKTIDDRSLIRLGIICSSLLLFIDFRYMVSFHYLPQLTKNVYIAEEIKTLVATFPQTESLRLVFDFVFFVLMILQLILFRFRSILKVFRWGLIFCLLIRLLVFSLDTYRNFVPLIFANTTASEIVKKEWLWFALWNIICILPIFCLELYVMLMSNKKV